MQQAIGRFNSRLLFVLRKCIARSFCVASSSWQIPISGLTFRIKLFGCHSLHWDITISRLLFRVKLFGDYDSRLCFASSYWEIAISTLLFLHQAIGDQQLPRLLICLKTLGEYCFHVSVLREAIGRLQMGGVLFRSVVFVRPFCWLADPPPFLNLSSPCVLLFLQHIVQICSRCLGIHTGCWLHVPPPVLRCILSVIYTGVLGASLLLYLLIYRLFLFLISLAHYFFRYFFLSFFMHCFFVVSFVTSV